MITISHTHADGTLVYGTSKGDGTAAILRAARFRWFPSIKLWGIAQSRDALAKRWQIDQAAKQLEAAGFEVTVEIDDTPRDVADVKADRAERLDTRYDRLTTKAERSAAEAESRRAAADRIAGGRPFGQPILVGHHSERRARADQKRVDGHDRAANRAYAKAEHAAASASVVGSAERYRERPGVIRRRIDKTEAELRKVQRQVAGTDRPEYYRDETTGKYRIRLTPATGAWLEQCEARKAFLEHQIAADRATLAEYEASGYVMLDRSKVHKGDVVTWGATWGDGVYGATVTRVNPKTVTLDRTRWPRTLGYEQIRTLECPHEGTTITVGAPKPATARREPVTVEAERPAEREAPLTVGAGSECFITPPPVAGRMLAAARLQPGMTVLEPSAGTGAIASAALAAGATVDCIELEYNLARVLDTGCYRQVIRADFLEYGPRDNPAGAEYYDRVLMNPPFAGQADIRHVTHALGFLKPGGLLVAILSAGAEFRQDKTATAFRDLVTDCGGRIERLPDDAFMASGTGTRTVMAVIPAPAQVSYGEIREAEAS